MHYDLLHLKTTRTSKRYVHSSFSNSDVVQGYNNNASTSKKITSSLWFIDWLKSLLI